MIREDAADRGWFHDREHIRMLHHAHADHVESLYTAIAKIAGNPQSAICEKIGPVRTFLVHGKRWENRAIFHGDESREQIDDVLRHFCDHEAHCMIEVNIANSYVDPPGNWETRLLPHLLSRGCQVGGMRCVWHRERAPSCNELAASHRIERFSPEQIRDYAALKMQMDPDESWTANRYHEESRPGLYHYVGFGAAQPCAFGSLFVKERIGYLSYWETQAEHRGRGLQQAGIRRRVADAFELGCEQVFTVSDYNFASPRNLERCGFSLAYDYLVVTREPLPVM